MVFNKISYTPQKISKEETWVSFMDMFWKLPQNVQTLVIEKLHGNTKTWFIQHKLLILDASKLTKYK
jgi:hypothetical protein